MLCGLRARQHLALERRDHVVRRRDEAVERAGRRGRTAPRGKALTWATAWTLPRLDRMAAISELGEDRVVEGVYAVARKRRLRTKGGAPYLALELVDPSGRLEARVWNDVELLDGRFEEGDAVRVLGRVEKFRDRLQLDVRSLEAAEARSRVAGGRVAARSRTSWTASSSSSAEELTHEGLRAVVGRFVGDPKLRARFRELPAAPDGHHGYAGGLLEHTVGVATICRETAQLHRRLRVGPARRGGAAARRGPHARSSARRRCTARPRRAGCSATCTSACG